MEHIRSLLQKEQDLLQDTVLECKVIGQSRNRRKEKIIQLKIHMKSLEDEVAMLNLKCGKMKEQEIYQNKTNEQNNYIIAGKNNRLSQL